MGDKPRTTMPLVRMVAHASLLTPHRYRSSWVALAALACGAAIGLCCSEPRAWPACILALLVVNVLVIDSARGSTARTMTVVAAAMLGWQAAASWWVMLAVHQNDQWTLLWKGLVPGVMVLAQVLWFTLAWWLMRAAWHRRESPSLASAAFAWCVAFAAADVMRQAGWSGDPYGSLGVALIDAPGVAETVPWIGAQGVTWAAMAITSVLALWLLRDPQAAPAPLWWRKAVGTIFAGLLAAIGFVQLAPSAWSSTETADQLPLNIVVMHPLIVGRGKWNAAVRDKALTSLFAAIEQSPPGSLLVTPESYLYEPPPPEPVGFWSELLRKVDAAQVHVLLGMPYLWRESESVQRLNAALHLAPGRQAVYAKERLVPGGEYMPLQDWLGPIYRRALDHEGVSEQPAPPGLTAPLYVEGIDVGASICYELAFPLTMAQRARDAGLLVNLSLDGWIPSAAFRRQMLAIARTRALESGRWLLRATDAKGSVLVDHLGQVLPPTRTQGDIATFEQVRPRAGQTLYNTLAEWLAAAPLLVAGGTLFSALMHRPTRLRMIRRSPT